MPERHKEEKFAYQYEVPLKSSWAKITGTNDLAYFSWRSYGLGVAKKLLRSCPPAGAGTKI